MNRIKIESSKLKYHNGEIIGGRLLLVSEYPVQPDAIRLQIIGLEKTKVPAIKGQLSHIYSDDNYILRNDIPIFESSSEHEEGKPAETEYIFEFRIPKFALPSYAGKNVDVSYKLNVQVDGPEGSDIADEQVFYVIRNKKDLDLLKMPVHFHSENYFKPDDGRPSFYAQLSKGGFSRGETIYGDITLKNIDGSKVNRVLIRLLGREFAVAKDFHKTVLLHKSAIHIHGDTIIKGIPVQFKFPIPKNIPASYEGMYSNYRWSLEVDLDWEFEIDVKASHPIEIVGT